MLGNGGAAGKPVREPAGRGGCGSLNQTRPCTDCSESGQMGKMMSYAFIVGMVGLAVRRRLSVMVVPRRRVTARFKAIAMCEFARDRDRVELGPASPGRLSALRRLDSILPVLACLAFGIWLAATVPSSPALGWDESMHAELPAARMVWRKWCSSSTKATGSCRACTLSTGTGMRPLGSVAVTCVLSCVRKGR